MRNIIIIAISGFAIVAAVLAFHFLSDRGADTPEIAVAPPPVAVPAQEPEVPAEAAPEIIAPSFDVVRVSREGTGVIAGRAQPDSEVTVLSNDKVIGRVTANRNGEWVLIFEEPLDTGTVELSIKARKGSAAPIDSDDIVVVSIPERQDNGGARPAEEGVVAVLSPRDGKGPSRVLQQPSQSSSPLADLLTVDTMDYDLDGMAIMTGRAKPNTEIRLYLDGEYQETVTTDAEGKWIYEPLEAISAGGHRLRLDQILDGDNVSLRIEQPFNREEALDTQLAEGQVQVQPGNNLWAIARQIYGAGVMYTLIFRENKDNILDPDLIYPNQLFNLPNPVGKPAAGQDASQTN